MSFEFKILDKQQITSIIPLMQKFTDYKFADEVLESRFLEMAKQNYECAVIVNKDNIIGICGMWFCTRHYSGRSVELDHVYIDDSDQNEGLGSRFLQWIYDYVTQKGCDTVELNTYVQNNKSHKFYYNQGFNILGYHFLKKL